MVRRDKITIENYDPIVEPAWGWPDLLLYRDYLRAHAEVAGAYAELKRRLAAADDQDRPRYRTAKSPFIRETLVAARQWQQRPPQAGRDRGHDD